MNIVHTHHIAHTNVELVDTATGALLTGRGSQAGQHVCIEDILSLEAAAKLYLNRAEAISHAGLGWFTDAYGRLTGMRSLESAMDQICRDWCSSVFVYAVSAARQAVMTVLVHGEDIHDHGFPTREQCALMTGFQGDEGGPWSTINSQTIVPGGSGSSSAPKKLRHASKIHDVQSHFLGALTKGVVFFDPGDRLCCHDSAPPCVACAH